MLEIPAAGLGVAGCATIIFGEFSKDTIGSGPAIRLPKRVEVEALQPTKSKIAATIKEITASNRLTSSGRERIVCKIFSSCFIFN